MMPQLAIEPPDAPAIEAVDVWRVYKWARGEVQALRGVQLQITRGTVRGAQRALGQRQDHAAQLHRRVGSPDIGHGARLRLTRSPG